MVNFQGLRQRSGWRDGFLQDKTAVGKEEAGRMAGEVQNSYDEAVKMGVINLWTRKRPQKSC